MLEKHQQSPLPGGNSSNHRFLLDLPVLWDVSCYDNGGICPGKLTVI